MKRTYTLFATFVVALALAGGLVPSVAQQSVVDGFRLPNGGYQFVTPTVGLPVKIVGGSGSSSVVFGPTANGSPAANPPVLMGGTSNGTATGNVGNWKVDSSGLGYISVTGWAGGTLGPMANFGSSPGAVLVPGVNAFVTNVPNVANTGTFAVQESTTFATVVSSAVTRVANTTQYTANTGWCTLTSSCVTTFSWANVCRANGGTILIPNISVYSSANQSTPLQGILWLFNTVPGTIISDDVTFNIASADFANLVGGSFNGIPFTLASSQASGASNAGISLTGLNYEATCASGSTTLYGMVQVVNTYTPVSAEVLTIRLHSIGLN